MCERQKAFKTVVFGGGCEQIWESTVCNPEAEERESVLVLKLALLPQTFSSFFLHPVIPDELFLAAPDLKSR